jgi:hypothetical protein
MSEVTEIVQALTALGGEAKTAFIFWVCFSYGAPMICCLAALAIIPRAIYKTVIRCNEAARGMLDLRERLFPRAMGPLTDYEVQLVMAELRKRLAAPEAAAPASQSGSAGYGLGGSRV